MGSEGFEPPKAKPGDLQSPPFDRSGNCPKIKSYPYLLLGPKGFSGKTTICVVLMEPLIGFEPMTIRLQGECSTSWAKVAYTYTKLGYFIKNTLEVKLFLKIIFSFLFCLEYSGISQSNSLVLLCFLVVLQVPYNMTLQPLVTIFLCS